MEDDAGILQIKFGPVCDVVRNLISIVFLLLLAPLSLQPI